MINSNSSNTGVNDRSTEWKCHLFNTKDLTYIPRKDCVPNFFVRWMMKVCFGCHWVRNKEKK